MMKINLQGNGLYGKIRWKKLEAIINEPSDTGVRKVIEGFWNAWQDVSKEPENLTSRAALKEKSIGFNRRF